MDAELDPIEALRRDPTYPDPFFDDLYAKLTPAQRAEVDAAVTLIDAGGMPADTSSEEVHQAITAKLREDNIRVGAARGIGPLTAEEEDELEERIAESHEDERAGRLLPWEAIFPPRRKLAG